MDRCEMKIVEFLHDRDFDDSDLENDLEVKIEW